MGKDLNSTHPLGEAIRTENARSTEAIAVDTFDGKIHVEWDPTAAVTPIGQLPFFIQFLKVSGLFDRWVTQCPLRFQSNNAPQKRDVLGSFLLSILSGHNRYAHMTSLLNDQVNSQLLGMTKVVSDDSGRRALKKIDEEMPTSRSSRCTVIRRVQRLAIIRTNRADPRTRITPI